MRMKNNQFNQLLINNKKRKFNKKFNNNRKNRLNQIKLKNHNQPSLTKHRKKELIRQLNNKHKN